MNATQLIKDPTRIAESSRTLIDIVLTSDPNLVKDIVVWSTGHNREWPLSSLRSVGPEDTQTQGALRYDP